MKLNRTLFSLACLLAFSIIACQKESSEEWGKPPLTPPITDTIKTTPADTTKTTNPPDTTKPAPTPVSITIKNPGFEDSLHFWKRETTYHGKYGFRVDTSVARTGRLGLNFYVSQPSHFAGALQETPFNGKMYQAVKGLKDGHYTFKVYADAVGNGMYLWANGGTGEVKVLIKSAVSEVNTLDFDVKGGVAMFGFICINADGPQKFAPYFHADDAELLMK